MNKFQSTLPTLLIFLAILFSACEPYSIDYRPPPAEAVLKDLLPESIGITPATKLAPGENVATATYDPLGKILIRRFISESELIIQSTITEKDSSGNTGNRFNYDLITKEVTVNRISYGECSGRFSTETGSIGFYWKNGRYLFGIVAPDEEKLHLLIDSFDFISRRSGNRPLIFIIEENFGLLFGAFILVALLSALSFLWLAFHYGEVFARRSPPASRSVSEKRELKEKLLSLNALDLPFSLTEDDDYELIAEWNITNTSFFPSEKVSDQKSVVRVRLKLDEKTNRTYINDQRVNIINAAAGATGLTLKTSLSIFSGVAIFDKRFPYSWGADLTRMSPDEIVTHDFDSRIIKDAIKRIVLECGWTYAPAILWFKTKK
jgi:hypothetical protein